MRSAVVLVFILGLIGSVNAEPTYSREISRIMQAKCQRCHRSGDIAPFPLTTYEEVYSKIRDIKRVIESRQMPPWKPVAGHGEFRDSYALTDEEHSTILGWINAETPEGDPADLPEPLAATGEWQMGEPDRVLAMAEEFHAPAGRDTYRCFVLPTGLDQDQYLTAIHVLPGEKRIVHHVLLFSDPTGESERLDANDPEPGYECFGGMGVGIGTGLADILEGASIIGGWVPGSRSQSLPEGVGIKLSKAARIVMQVHYFGGSEGGVDQTRAGLYFAKAPVNRRLFYLPLANTTFKIPAYAKDYEVKTEFTVPPFLDAKLIQIAPHMHLLGKQIKVESEYRGDKTDLVYIDDWDFHWQGFYTYEREQQIKSGTVLRLTCTYDNSEDNFENPNTPPKIVGWGEETQDEMCLAYLGVTFDFGALLGLR